MSLAANALISVEEFKIFAALGGESIPDLDRVEALINSASQYIERYCERKFIRPVAAVTETFDGSGLYYQRLDNAPFAATPTNLQYRYYIGDDWKDSDYTFETDDEKGLIILKDGHLFSSGILNWRVDYLYGYELADVPQDLKRATAGMVLAARNKLQLRMEGIDSHNYGEQSWVVSREFLSPELENLLAGYRRYWI